MITKIMIAYKTMILSKSLIAVTVITTNIIVTVIEIMIMITGTMIKITDNDQYGYSSYCKYYNFNDLRLQVLRF